MEEGPSFGVLVTKEANTQGKVRSNERVFPESPCFHGAVKCMRSFFTPRAYLSWCSLSTWWLLWKYLSSDLLSSGVAREARQCSTTGKQAGVPVGPVHATSLQFTEVWQAVFQFAIFCLH